MNFENRRNAKFEVDDTSYQAFRKRKHEGDLKQKANGKTKKHGTTRFFRSMRVYPVEIMKLLKGAIEIYAKLQGQKYVYWNDVVKLFDLVLLEEYARDEEEGLLKGMEFTEEGKPRYESNQYLKAVETILEQSTQPKRWLVVKYKEEESKAAIHLAAQIGGRDKLIEHAFKKLYE
jgi:hypothetical protein